MLELSVWNVMELITKELFQEFSNYNRALAGAGKINLFCPWHF